MKLSLETLAVMCEGSLSTGSNGTLVIDNVVIDSREVKDESLFVAIKGKNQDSHAYVSTVINEKICVALVNSNCNIDLPNLIYVEDTVRALGILAHNYRMQYNIPIVAITGSNGKTTVKEMLLSICKKQFGDEYVLATSGNFNNHLGVPLTLLKLSSNHKVAIIEMGMNHSGELEYLSRLACPTLAVVNNVMFAHAGFFHDLTEIAKAKGEIYNGLIPGGVACINLSSPFASMWQEQVSKTMVNILNYAEVGSSCYRCDNGLPGKLIIKTSLGDKIICKLRVLGEHNKQNALTATALALNLNCGLNNIVKGLSSYQGFKGRLEQKTAFNGALVIDDSYNANPDSVKAAILAIKDLPKPHWFIFADLKELGKFSHEAHIEIGQFATSHGIDCLLTVGELSKISHQEFNGIKLHFDNNQDVVKYCMQFLPKNATLLVKGSNSMELSVVVTQLTNSK